LWITQSHVLSDKENAENFKTVFETIEDIENVTLIIKQHPGEGERFTRMINNYLGNHEIEAVLTEKNSDTYEQIYVCDLLMTKTSTTALEAVALNKPVIILNLSGIADTVDYVQQGVALGVHRGKDLRTVIERLLTSDIELARNREQFIRKYLHKIDGKATERVVNIIGKIISKEK
jgi:CDP-glycerol glycerophosphotransferase (TagB/SpsB family)